MGIPAVPATVVLRMRLQRADGSPLASTWYRIRWGNADPSPAARTHTDGMIDEELDARYTRGILEVGDNDPDVPDDKAFVPHLYIDLHLVKPPGPPGKHQRGKINPETDSPLEPGAKPRQEPGPSREPAKSEEPSPTAVDPGLISMPPDKPRRDWDPEGRYPKHDKKPEGPTVPPAEAERRLERLDRATAGYHDKRAKVYELTWRLHNLGFLGFWSGHLTFPIDGGKYAEILDAMNRYACKYGLSLLKEEDLSSPDGALDMIMAHVSRTHDATDGNTP